LKIPAELGESITDNLIEKGLLVKTAEPRPGLVLARDPEQIKLSDITESLADLALAQPNLDEPSTLAKLVEAQRQFLAKHNLKEILTPIETRGLSDIPDRTPAQDESETDASEPPAPA
jgi:DNA-binding IscR family transcriptional regulator